MSKIPKITQFSNALKDLFTVRRNSAAASKPHTEEGRKANLSETRPKNRLREFFSWFKALFKRKDKNIGSRDTTSNPNTTNIRDADIYAPVISRSERMLSKLVPFLHYVKSAKGLNVTQDYIQEFANNNISFTDLYGIKQTGNTLKLTQKRPASYSDHLTKFCGGDTIQALRLSKLLTRDSLDVMSPIITGKEACQWLQKSFDVSKIEDDGIKVEIKGTLVDPNEKETTVQNVTIILPPEESPDGLSVEAINFFKTPAKTDEDLDPPPLNSRADDSQQDSMQQENIQATNIMPEYTEPIPMTEKIFSQLDPMVRRARIYQGSNVTRNYIQEFAINNIEFLNSVGETETADTLNLTPGQTASYSNHLTKFCGGNKDQARRLSAVLTTDSLDIVSLAIAGETGAIAAKTGHKSHTWSRGNFDVTAGSWGNIRVQIAGAFRNNTTGKIIEVRDVTITVVQESGSHALRVDHVDFL